MTIFTVPNLGGGAPGPSGAPGAPGTGGSYGSILAVFLFSSVQQAFVANVEQKVLGYGTNLANNGVTPDQANDRLIINEDGVYEIYWMQSYVGTVSWTFNFLEVRKNNLLVPEVSLTDYEGVTLAFVASGSSCNAVSCLAGDVIEMYAETSANVTISWRDACLLAWRISA